MWSRERERAWTEDGRKEGKAFYFHARRAGQPAEEQTAFYSSPYPLASSFARSWSLFGLYALILSETQTT